MAWNNMYRPDYEYAKIVGAANLIEPVAKYVNVLKDEHVANMRYAQEWEAKQEAAKQKKLLDQSTIDKNNADTHQTKELTQPKVNETNAKTYLATTGAEKNVAEVPQIQANTELKKSEKTKIDTLLPLEANEKNANVELSNNQIAESQQKQTWYPKAQQATITHKNRTGKAALGQVVAAQTSANAAAANAKTNKEKAAETARSNKVTEGITQQKANAATVNSLSAPTFEEKKELKQTPAGKTAGKYENPVRGL